MKIKTLIIAGVSVAAACITGLAVFGAMKIAKTLCPKKIKGYNDELVEDYIQRGKK